jgi:cellulose synthase/poly-beta-1,6-N-acetylglucosamine synthase-like glycosyltransferase
MVEISKFSDLFFTLLLSAIPLGMMLCAALYLLRNTRKATNTPSKETIALLIPVRNEAPLVLHNLKRRLESIQEQQHIHCTLIDDGSSIPLQPFLNDSNLQLIRIESGTTGSKKNALSTAVKQSKADWIITSDADTTNGATWIDSLRYAMKPNVDFCASPVFISDEPRFITQYSQCESVCLWTIALSTQFLGAPLLCSGANLAFRRQAFLDSGGYEKHMHIPSGDDVLLMHQLWKRNSGSVTFCVDKDAACFTKAPETWNAWFKQRRRWISKTGHVQHPLKLLMLVFTAVWLYLPIGLVWVSLPNAGLLLAIETMWVVFLTRNYALRSPRFEWLLFRLSYPLILPFVFFIRPGMWKAQGKN